MANKLLECMEKGKKYTALYIRDECLKSNHSSTLDELLNIILNTAKPIDDLANLDWLRWLVAAGRTPDEFSADVRRYDNSSCCGLVWTANFVAYRCRTCGISPCMSLCAECFCKGDHEGHDFNMFRSQAGGACDCGDTSVMRESGFCHQHGIKKKNLPSPPQDLLCVSQAIIIRVIHRLVEHLRDNSVPDQLDFLTSAINIAKDYIGFLHQLSEMGAAMRQVISNALCNEEAYKDSLKENSKFSIICLRRYEMARKSIPMFKAPPRLKHIVGLQQELEHKTYLDELVFWTIKYEFPQKLVCFLLNMLPDRIYKEAFTSTFVYHYSRVAALLSKSESAETLANHVVHVSVQLFSNEELSLMMCKKHQLLHIIILSLKDMLFQALAPSTITDPSVNFHYTVDCSSSSMKHHCFWPLVSDLSNILSHHDVALLLFEDLELLQNWFEILAMLQGMNVNRRELDEHVEYESNTYYAAFSAEIEISAATMWSLVSHLKNRRQLHLTKQLISCCTQELQTWFDALGYSTNLDEDPLNVSFHLPLHRYYAVLLSNALKHQDASFDDIVSVEMWKQILVHPLRAQIGYHQIMNGLWVRNGLQIKGQAMTYMRCKFCYSMVDPDLYLLQLCAMNLDSDYFVRNVVERFNVFDWFTLQADHKHTSMDQDQELQMLYSCLIFFATVITLRTNTGLNMEEVLKQEMATLLCMSDRTHSQLMDLLPEKFGSSDSLPDGLFELILSEVAEYVDPNLKSSGNMSQGMYVPKAEIWEHYFDPIFAYLRSVHRKEYQAAIDRFGTHVKQSGKHKDYSSLWPPYRLPKPVGSKYKQHLTGILHCKSMYSLIFIALYKCLNHAHLPDNILPLIIHLIHMAVNSAEKINLKGQIEPLQKVQNVQDKDISNWFSSANFLLVVQENIDVVYFELKDKDCGIHKNSCNESMTMESLDVDILMDDVELDQHAVENGPERMALQFNDFNSTDGAHALVPMNGNNSFSGEELDSSSSMLSLSSIGSYSVLPNVERPLALEAPFYNDPLVVVPSFNDDSPRSPFSLDMNTQNKSVTCPHRKALPCDFNKPIQVHESILSLLVKLHCKLSDGKKNSYIPLSRRTASSNSCKGDNISIGDGPHFISQVIDKISELTDSSAVEKICEKIWPTSSEKNMPKNLFDGPTTSVDKEERKRRAKDHQKKLMAEFASRQKAFMKRNLDTDFGGDVCGEGSSASTNEHMESQLQHEYDCVICGQTSPSTSDRPIGLVTLLQASSVLGHSLSNDQISEINFPCSEREQNILSQRKTRSMQMNEKIEILSMNFSETSWQTAINLGWEGGVYAISCNHYLHLDCHKSYMQSLKREGHRGHSGTKLAVDRGEYSCPLCRQLANTVLPCCPSYGENVAIVKCRENNLLSVSKELAELLANASSPKVSDVMRCMVLVMEDITNATYPQFRSIGSSPNPHSLLLFVCSIVRTNLEIELVHRGGYLCSRKSFKSCFATLFKVLALNIKILNAKLYTSLWSKISGLCLYDTNSVSLIDQEVPLLLQDPIALLIQMTLTLPPNIDRAFYSCLAQGIFNLTCMQALMIISYKTDRREQQRWKNRVQREITVLGTNRRFSLLSFLGILINYIDSSLVYLSPIDMHFEEGKILTSKEIELQVREYTISFLRIANLLQHYLFNIALPQYEPNNEFYDLCVCLGFQCHEDSSNSDSSAANFLSWVYTDPLKLLLTWSQDFSDFASRSQISARALLEKSFSWHQPHLLKLPREYHVIFQYYRNMICTRCYSVPKDPSICLICGKLVCLREPCCRREKTMEAVQHSISCGAGTAMYLVVNSSTIIVIRDKRACIWGSVYLDVYGEEDRDLKRGKPLYLCEERYALLEKQWLNHTFDHTNNHWIWHKDTL